jgi:predicted MFS family arabinose efflux permease
MLPTIEEPSASRLTPALTGILAVACGLTVANLYYAQPLISVIAVAIGLRPRLAGLVMTLTQLGYGVGLLLIVPLADLIENRRLICGVLCAAALGLFAITSATNPSQFLSASFAVGVCAVAAQVLVPFASHLTPAASRGRITGRIMGGLLTGIMLARPVSSFIAGRCGWRAVFAVSGVLLLVLVGILRQQLPERRPAPVTGYRAVLASMWQLVLHTPLLRWRALSQGIMFAAFNMFWTGSPLLLMRHYGMTFNGVALFSLVGAGGALAAPLAGHLADLGLTKLATRFSMLVALAALIVAAWADHIKTVPILAIAGLSLDAAVQMCLVLSLRGIYMLESAKRSRLNGLFMAWVFGCGASASGAAASIYELEGWLALMACGVILVTIGLALNLIESSSVPQA